MGKTQVLTRWRNTNGQRCLTATRSRVSYHSFARYSGGKRPVAAGREKNKQTSKCLTEIRVGISCFFIDYECMTRSLPASNVGSDTLKRIVRADFCEALVLETNFPPRCVTVPVLPVYPLSFRPGT